MLEAVRHLALHGLMPAVMAVYLPFCAAEVRPVSPPDARRATLWVAPADLEARDLYHGPWGAVHAPDPQAAYTFVARKHGGVNPGLTVRDAEGRVWSVKQVSPDALASEGQIEVVMSRLLSAVGYHQPPVYYLPSFTLVDEWGRHTEGGGRFRLKQASLKDRGEWSWQQNPFVGRQPYQGLLVILLLLNSSDLKNSNNTLYEHHIGDGVELWHVVRDLGMSLGSTGRLAPRRGDPQALASRPFITGVGADGFVQFGYRGWHQELVRQRITPADVRWAVALMSRLSDRQFLDAFRAGGYDAEAARRFTNVLRARIEQGRQIAHEHVAAATEGR